MAKSQTARYIGEGFFVVLMLAVVVANAVERNWVWFGIGLGFLCLWLIQLTANVVLSLVEADRKGHR